MQTAYTYNQDGRLSYKDLYAKYDALIEGGWSKKLVYRILGRDLNGTDVELFCYAYLSPKSSENAVNGAFWILSGIHGEEPAGPNALAENTDLIAKLWEQGIPVVLIPLLNPLGYIRDDRYFDSHRLKKGDPAHSITDAEHLLPDLTDPRKPRAQEPSNQYAEQVLKWIQKTVIEYPPLVVFDHHEDEIDHTETENINSGYTYSYCYGNPTNTKAVCRLITDLLIKNSFPIQESGKTWFDEEIAEGFVFNSNDGSVDEYLANRGAKACFVVETTRDDEQPISLAQRVQVHQEIIKTYPEMWTLLKA